MPPLSDMLQNGLAWLSQQLTAHASRAVIYRRDALSAELRATIGRSLYEQDNGEGVITRSQVRDYLIDTSELMNSVIGSLPRRGDQIIELENNCQYTFEVMSLAGEPPWRYSDPFRLKLRIHTRQIDNQG